MKRGVVLLTMMTGLAAAAAAEGAEEQNAKAGDSFYALITEAEDYGASVTKIIADYGILFEAGKELKKEDFSVSVVRNYAGTQELAQVVFFGSSSHSVSETAQGEREITKVYLSDEAGNPTNDDSQYVTFEMAYGPDEGYGNPLGSELETGLGMNVVLDCSYTLTYTDETGRTFLCDTRRDELCRMPEVDEFTHDQIFTDTSESIVNDEYENETLYYASYEPKEEGTHPLIIWLHGMGEGGRDTRLPLLAAKTGVFVRPENQKIFGGAYVLIPQCPLVWMNTGNGDMSMTASQHTSIYTVVLMDLIEQYVTDHPDIDRDRIYIGGCSNGGYMTMNLLIRYPDYFAAAYPICEAYKDEYISDEEIEKIKEIPIWFTHAATDSMVDPTIYTLPTYERLIKAGAPNVKFTYWTNVHDTTGRYQDENGNPEEYFGHFSWRYFLNNECTLDRDYSYGKTCDDRGNGKTVFEWLAEQSK